MAELKLIVFDVERGLCVFVRTPTGYGLMVDCGRSQDFSPAEYIADQEAPNLTKWNGHNLAWLIVTHPHDDHVEDINTVISKLPPAILLRHKEYDWQAILNPPGGDPSTNAKRYHGWQQRYSAPVEQRPDLGLHMQTFALSLAQADKIDPNPQHSLNNSSYVTVLTYQSPGMPEPWKVVISGDNETAGWEALLRRQAFCDAIRGADIFVTSHHGHESGFSSDLFEVMGKPFLNITSERAGDQSVYSYHPYARGLKLYGEDRYHLTTRDDGHIVLRLRDDLTLDPWMSRHER